MICSEQIDSPQYGQLDGSQAGQTCRTDAARHRAAGYRKWKEAIEGKPKETPKLIQKEIP
jgi:hypothetical protein